MGNLNGFIPSDLGALEKNRLTMKHEDLSMGKCEE